MIKYQARDAQKIRHYLGDVRQTCGLLCAVLALMLCHGTNEVSSFAQIGNF